MMCPRSSGRGISIQILLQRGTDCSVSDAINKRKLKFLTKLRHSENTIYKLSEKYIVEELDTVHRHFVKLSYLSFLFVVALLQLYRSTDLL